MKRTAEHETRVQAMVRRLVDALEEGASPLDQLDAMATVQAEVLATTAPDLQQALNLQRAMHKAICAWLREADRLLGIPYRGERRRPTLQ